MTKGSTQDMFKTDPSFKYQSPKKDKMAENNHMLFIQEAKFVRQKMNVELKMLNTELWISDYNEDPDSRAKILALKFLSNINY